MVQKKSIVSLGEVKGLLHEDRDFLKELLHEVIQEVLEAEMNDALGAQKGERTGDRLGYRSGYYPRALITRVGKLELRVPQDRQGRFSTEVFERYQRSEKALVSALAEVCPGSLDAAGQGVNGRTVRSFIFCQCGEWRGQAAGRTVIAICSTSARGSVRLCDS